MNRIHDHVDLKQLLFVILKSNEEKNCIENTVQHICEIFEKNKLATKTLGIIGVNKLVQLKQLISLINIISIGPNKLMTV